MSVLENIEFRVIKENWSGNGTWIYLIRPIGENRELLQRHPVYNTYSVISKKEFMIGQVVTADLEERVGRDGSMNYIFVREVFRFPSDPVSQWEFFDRIANNHSFKRVYNQFLAKLSPNVNVLDYIMDNELAPEFLGEKLFVPYIRLRETIDKYKRNALFIEHIPRNIAKLLSDAAIEKLSGMSSTAEKSAKDFLDQPFSAITQEGLGFKTLDKIREMLAEEYPHNFNYSPQNPIRLYYGAYDIITRNVIKSGDTYIKSEELSSLMIDDLGLPSEPVNEFIERGYRNQPEIEGLIIHKYKDSFTTKSLYDAENITYRFLSVDNGVTPDPKINAAVEDYIQNSGNKFSQEQLEFLRSVNHNRVNVLAGGGGTGKTWLVSKLIDIYESVYKYSTLLTAPTGKASHVLSVYTGKKAHTIHSAFNVSPERNSLHGQLSTPKGRLKLIVFDESSMIDSELMGNIVYALGVDNMDIRVVFIGDPYQLPSVGPGNILHNLLKYDVANVTTLTKVFRVGDSQGGISRLSESFRKGRFPFKDIGKAEAVGGDLVIENIEDNDRLHDRVITAYLRLLSKDGARPEDIMVLSPQNKGVTGQANLNVSIQKVVRSFYKRTDASYLSRTVHGVEMDFYPDDLVIFNRTTSLEKRDSITSPVANWSGSNFNTGSTVQTGKDRADVTNGDIGIIDSMDDRGMIVTIIGKDYNVYVPKSELSKISLGYAFTIHKSQGSQSAYGIMAISSRDAYSLNSNLLYTGVSRFINKLYLFGNYRTIRYKANTFINLSRNTLLEEWLKEEKVKNVVF